MVARIFDLKPFYVGFDDMPWCRSPTPSAPSFQQTLSQNLSMDPSTFTPDLQCQGGYLALGPHPPENGRSRIEIARHPAGKIAAKIDKVDEGYFRR